MASFPNLHPARRITRTAFWLSLASQVIPILFSFYTIATATYYRAPLYSETRLVILILGLGGALLGGLALYKGTRSRFLAIFAIFLGLTAPLWHVAFCGSDALHQSPPICPMLWGIRIP